MRRRLTWLAAGLLSAARLAADTVLYPRTPAAEHLPAGAPGSVSLTTSLLVILVGIGAGWLLWRRLRSVNRTTGGARQLAIAETRSLGNRQFLVVATYGEKKFLLGVCPGRVDLLAPLDGGLPPSQ